MDTIGGKTKDDVIAKQADNIRRLREINADLLKALEDLLRDEQLDDDDARLCVTRINARAAIARAKEG